MNNRTDMARQRVWEQNNCIQFLIFLKNGLSGVVSYNHL